MKTFFLSILIFIFSCSFNLYATLPGKVLITGFIGTEPTDTTVQQLRELIDDGYVGGIILFKRNIVNKSQLKQLIKYLTKTTDIFVVIDHEGGIVNRLTHESFDLKTPSPESFCKLPKSEQQIVAKKISSTLRDVGINTNLGGVVDIAPYIYQSSICKYKRCFGDNQDKISACTSVLINSHDEEDVFFALKHFPGHGSTPVDSHYDLPDISTSHSEYDFMPYHRLFNQSSNYQMVMIGHLMNDQFDNKYPASLSKKHISYLTNELNYKGLIITDDLNMGALYKFSRNKTKIATMALAAGNHLLLFEYLTYQQIKDINETLANESKTSVSLNKHLLSSYDLIDSSLIFND